MDHAARWLLGGAALVLLAALGLFLADPGGGAVAPDAEGTLTGPTASIGPASTGFRRDTEDERIEVGDQATAPQTTPTTTGAATTEEASSEPLAGKTILVDPGHNGGNGGSPSTINRKVDVGNGKKACDTTGTATNGGYSEAAFTWDVSSRLAAILRRRGAEVVLTREGNRGVGPCITERAAIGNRAEADAAVSVHADGGPGGGRGFHVIYPGRLRGLTDDILPASATLARDMRAAYKRGTRIPESTYLGSRGLDERTDLGGLNLSDVPKVFVETGNMRNSRDAALLTDARFRGRIARAIADGLQRYVSR